MDIIGKVLFITDDEKFQADISGYLFMSNLGIDFGKISALPAEIDLSQFDCVVINGFFNDIFEEISFSESIGKLQNIPIIYYTDSESKLLIESASNLAYNNIIEIKDNFDELILSIENSVLKNKLKKYEDIATHYEEKFFDLLNANKDSVYFINNDGTIEFLNESAEKLFGFSSESAKNNLIWQLIIPEENRPEFIDSFNRWKKTEDANFFHCSMELYCTKKNGDYIPVEINLVITNINRKRQILAFIRDITEKLVANEEIEKLFEEMQVTKEIVEHNASELVMLNYQLQESEQQLKEINASKDKFFSIIAHDLKNPFQSLLGYSQLLHQDINNLEKDEIAEFAENLNISAERLFKLLENLLDWARLQRGKMEFNPDNYILTDLTLSNMEIVEMKAKEKNITLVHNVSNDIWVYADYQMLNTVIRNLLSNSVKFTNANGTIELGATLDDKLTIYVKDTGVGMSLEAQNKIFRIDQHHSTVGTGNEQGTGLGLILCKELVEKNNGSIGVKSEVGVGTTFYFTVPIGVVPEFD